MLYWGAETSDRSGVFPSVGKNRAEAKAYAVRRFRPACPWRMAFPGEEIFRPSGSTENEKGFSHQT